MQTLIFCIGHLLLASLLGGCAYLAGRVALRRFQFTDAGEGAVFALALGAGLLGHAVFLLGLLGLLNLPALVTLALALIATSYPRWRGGLSHLATLDRRTLGRTLLWTGGLLLGTALIWLTPLHPPSSSDATMYHLALARAHARTHHIAPLPYVRYPVFPQLCEMLFAAMLVAGGEAAAQLVSFLMLALLAAGLFFWGRSIHSPGVGRLAAALFVGSPMVYWLGTEGYIDLALAVFCTFATWAFCHYRTSGQERWLLLCAALGGLAASTKYTGLFFLGFFGLWTLGRSLQQRRIGPVLRYAAVGAALGIPWYLFIAWHTGNPVFPFLTSLFGYGSWTVEDLRGQMADLRQYGMGRGPLSFLLLPWNLTFHQHAFQVDFPLWPIPFIALPFLIAAARRDQRLATLLWVGLGYALFWFSAAQIARYLMPIWPILCLVTVASLARFFKPRRVVPCLAIAVLLAPAVGMGIYRTTVLGWPPATPQAREAFLLRHEPQYGPLSYLNQTRPQGYRVYALDSSALAYFADGTLIGDWFGPGRFSRIEAKLHSGAALYAELRALDCDYFLFTTYRPRSELPHDAAFTRHFRPVYAQPGATLFALQD